MLQHDMEPVKYRGNLCEWDGQRVFPDRTSATLEFSRREGMACITVLNSLDRSGDIGTIYPEGAYLVRIKACKDGRAYFVVPQEYANDLKRCIAEDRSNFTVLYLNEKDKEKDFERLEEIHKRILLRPDQMVEAHKRINDRLLKGALLSLVDVLSNEIIGKIVEDGDSLQTLCSLLPEEFQTKEDVKKILSSSGSKQCIHILESLIKGKDLYIAAKQFDVDEKAIQSFQEGDPVMAFIKMLQDKYGPKD